VLGEKGVTLAIAPKDPKPKEERRPEISENLGDQALAFASRHWKGIALTIVGLAVLLYIRHQVKVFLRGWRERRSEKGATSK